MPFPADTQFGPYKIIALIGSGGMGEVYRSRDTRLLRDVALKVLPAAFTNDPDRLRRFEQEARAVAALNHPNIVSVYDVGATDAVHYIVSELLEGETLRERIPASGMPTRKAIELAVLLANGLAAAHGATFVATQTDAGQVLGTVGYMSPEQVRGEAVDHRSDVFSFGSILYEMIAGQRAFKRNTAAETMTAILNDDPPDFPSRTAAIVPALERIVRHCLEKQPRQRFQSAHDIAFDLESVSGISTTSTSLLAAPRSKTVLRAALAALVLLAAGLGLGLVLRPKTSDVHPIQ